MNFDADDLDLMVDSGRRVNGHRRVVPVVAPPPAAVVPAELLEEIRRLSSSIRGMVPPDPVINVAAPVVNVPQAQVTVQPSIPVTKWKFTLTKDRAGNTTEIIATALK